MKSLYKILVPILIIILLIPTIIIIIKLSAKEDIDISTNTQINRLDTTIEDAEGTTFVRIEADIIGSDTDSFPVVSLLRYDFTNDDIKAYADTFFDNSEYHNQPYVEEYTVNDIDKIIEQLNGYKEDIIENRPSNMSDSDYSDTISSIDVDINYYTTIRSNAPTDSELRCDTTYNPYYTYQEYLMYSTSKIPNNEFENKNMGCILEGTYKGNAYRLSFDKTNESKATYMTIQMNSPDTIVWKDFTYDQVTYDPYHNQMYGTSSTTENACIYTEEDAIMLCNDMLRQLNINDMSVININDLRTNAYLSRYSPAFFLDIGNCGYYISYGKTINDKSLNYTFTGSPGEEFVDDGEGGSKLVPGPESLSFIVMDSGIVSINYSFPTVIESISSDSTPLLSFDTIMSIFENEMIENYSSNRYYKTAIGNIVITKIQLGLTPVTVDVDNGEYALIPAWIFYADNWEVVTINAIDGSIIR